MLNRALFVAGLVWFWLSQRRSRPGDSGAQPAGPKMAVPKGRVRPGG